MRLDIRSFLSFLFISLSILFSSCEKEPDQYQQVTIEGYVKTKGTNNPLSGVTLKLITGAVAPFFGGSSGIEIIQETKSDDQGYYKFELEVDTYKSNRIITDDLPPHHFGYDILMNPIKLKFKNKNQRLDIPLSPVSWVKFEFRDPLPYNPSGCIYYDNGPRFYGGQGSVGTKTYAIEGNKEWEFNFTRYANCGVLPFQRDSVLVAPIAAFDTVVYQINL